MSTVSLSILCVSGELADIVDDCWMMKDGRDEDGHLVPNSTRFPDGINGLADKVHQMGFKLGIYQSESQL